MEFLHISDLHYRIQYPAAETGYLSIFMNMPSPLEQLKKGLEKVCPEQLSFILISGDLTEDGAEEDYRELKRQLDQIFGRIPYVVTPGNHDNLDAFCRVWEPLPDDDVHCGTVHCFGDVRVIALNNASEYYPDGIITAEHCIWLEARLREISGERERVILMMHHPLITDPASSMPAAEYDPGFSELIRKYPVAAILCGHTHDRLSGTFNNVLFATAGSMSFKGYELPGGTVCFREYASMNLCRIEDRYISIKEIPVMEEGKVLGTIRMTQSVR